MCHNFGRLVCPIIFLFRCGISRGPSKTHCSRLGGLPPLATWALGQAFAHCAWLGFAMPMWQHAWFVQSFSCFAVELCADLQKHTVLDLAGCRRLPPGLWCKRLPIALGLASRCPCGSTQSSSCSPPGSGRCSGDMSGAPPSWVQRVSGLWLPHASNPWLPHGISVGEARASNPWCRHRAVSGKNVTQRGLF